ncbi:MAG TPA: hypothetical protein VLV16_09220 [Gemmatimonadales bacterium]|nr:hypothetical protein [Gemmatimonadales bacterium]
MRSSVKHAALVGTVMAGALVVGVACTGPDSPDDVITAFQAVAAGNNVTPHKNPADTAARHSFTINGSGTTFTFTYAVTAAGHGTVNLIRILQGTVTKGTICAAAPCAASGSVAGVTDTVLYRTLRNYGATVRVYSDSDPAGLSSGAIGPVSP